MDVRRSIAKMKHIGSPEDEINAILLVVFTEFRNTGLALERSKRVARNVSQMSGLRLGISVFYPSTKGIISTVKCSVDANGSK